MGIFSDNRRKALSELFIVLEKGIDLLVNESLDKDLSCYNKGFDPKKDFFCKTLCSFRDRCLNE